MYMELHCAGLRSGDTCPEGNSEEGPNLLTKDTMTAVANGMRQLKMIARNWGWTYDAQDQLYRCPTCAKSLAWPLGD